MPSRRRSNRKRRRSSKGGYRRSMKGGSRRSMKGGSRRSVKKRSSKGGKRKPTKKNDKVYKRIEDGKKIGNYTGATPAKAAQHAGKIAARKKCKDKTKAGKDTIKFDITIIRVKPTEGKPTEYEITGTPIDKAGLSKSQLKSKKEFGVKYVWSASPKK